MGWLKKTFKKVENVFRGGKKVKYQNEIPNPVSAQPQFKPIDYVSIADNLGNEVANYYRTSDGGVKVKYNNKIIDIRNVSTKNIDRPNVNTNLPTREEIKLGYDKAILDSFNRQGNMWAQYISLQPAEIPEVAKAMADFEKAQTIVRQRGFSDMQEKYRRIMESTGNVGTTNAIEAQSRIALQQARQLVEDNIKLQNYGNEQKQTYLNNFSDLYKSLTAGVSANTEAYKAETANLLEQRNQNLMQDVRQKQLQLEASQQQLQSDIANQSSFLNADIANQQADIAKQQASLQQEATYLGLGNSLMNATNDRALNASAIDAQTRNNLNAFNLQAKQLNKNPWYGVAQDTALNLGYWGANKLIDKFGGQNKETDIFDIAEQNQKKRKGGTLGDIIQQGARLAANYYAPGSGEVINTVGNKVRTR